jgi:hypothetical protein
MRLLLHARVFVTLIVLPLGTAYLTERAIERRPSRQVIVDRLGWLPVPPLGIVVFIIAASQVQVVTDSLPILGRVAAVFVVYLVAVAAIGASAGRAIGLPAGPARTLVFSLGTRNSFVVLPFALALPGSWDIAVVVIVMQSLVELLAMARFSRRAVLQSDGEVVGGAGHVAADSAFAVPVAFPSSSGEPPGRTMPEEMLAASHATCYGIGLRSLIGRRGGRARRVTVTATVTAEKGEGRGGAAFADRPPSACGSRRR